ncbi:MAG TPA: TolC family protein [Acidobacteriaceae bacterium]|nr:TolC family protein [Acidobacteriaceae bacterium]
MNLVERITALLGLASVAALSAQQIKPGAPVALAQLLAEANTNNSQISAADHDWQAARRVPREVTTLPDPTAMVQQFSVGSPKPFAGYTNSDFAYIGIGAAQELPYPGKLRLRGQTAERAADIKGAQLDAVKATVTDGVKDDYLQLAYLQKTLGILMENKDVLGQLIQNATAHYEVGQGMQQDVLQAQVERTRILRDITMHHQQMWQVQAHLKALLHRDQSSPDVVTEDLTESPLRTTSAELLNMVRERNPQVQVDASTLHRQEAQLASAKREGKPDFDIAYEYENTDRKYRDYYMLTFDVRFPRKKRVDAQIAEAAEMLESSRSALDAELQQQLAAVQQEYVTASSDTEALKEYREGLIPQSDAVYRATLSAYAANREQFTRVLLAFTDVLNRRLEYAQTLMERERALAHLETLTGASLR